MLPHSLTSAASLHILKGENIMINKTNGAWVLARETAAAQYGHIKDQVAAMQAELHSEGYVLKGVSSLHFPVISQLGEQETEKVIRAAENKLISAVFVFSIKHIDKDLNVAFKFVDRLNELGVIVYDNEGYQYSYDWYCKQIGKRFKGGKQ